MIAAAFLLYILFTSNPFIRLWPAPANGNDLNPLLQDPGLVFHPPCLYLGYVGFSIVFSFAVAALIEGRCDRAWASQDKAVGACGVERADARHRHGQLVGILHAGLGRLVVLGSGRKREPDAVAGRHGAAAFDHRRRAARSLERLDAVARHSYLQPVAARHVSGALGRA